MGDVFTSIHTKRNQTTPEKETEREASCIQCMWILTYGHKPSRQSTRTRIHISEPDSYSVLVVTWFRQLGHMMLTGLSPKLVVITTGGGWVTTVTVLLEGGCTSSVVKKDQLLSWKVTHLVTGWRVRELIGGGWIGRWPVAAKLRWLVAANQRCPFVIHLPLLSTCRHVLSLSREYSSNVLMHLELQHVIVSLVPIM